MNGNIVTRLPTFERSIISDWLDFADLAFEVRPLSPQLALYLLDQLYDGDKKVPLNNGRMAGADAEMMATLISICESRRIWNTVD
ncbi:hypothetical protein HBH70_161500 [Parastagonospora nodorum]|nr:hypothetical protein HBI09_195900 [Parastagonospora nodorum]KAH5132505.1 hypothetical protein HBH70_161500 [Parastagonospora nodorum]KAH5257787.1 hypothetical protein HBI70_178560 [Parastagonospora nodorum]KAH5563743.1 hypothetical protein HBI26_179150 [Parastagonospora nodorum]